MKQYKYSKFDLDRVNEVDIHLAIPGAPSRHSEMMECPFCGKKKFSLVHKAGKNFAHCFACEKGFSGPIDAVMHYSGKPFLDAVEAVAQLGGIVLVPQNEAPAPVPPNKKPKAKKEPPTATPALKAFWEEQLESSGLTVEDVAVTIEGEDAKVSPFRRGRSVSPSEFEEGIGDDMLIYYYDLEGQPMTYVPPRGRKPRPYSRIRFNNPDLHVRHGDPVKYLSPLGSESKCYIPERIRQAYKAGEHIETLFLQEGEKKAEKACKHGMLSVGIQGINNTGSVEAGPFVEIQKIAQVCGVRNIVLVMDSDWNNLHRRLTHKDSVDARPKQFSKAVIKFRQFTRSFHNIGLDVEIWWGHVNENANGDKGVDDLLIGSLKGREADLMVDANFAMNSHNGKGTWINIHKITEISDVKIRAFWLLDDVEAFYTLHNDRLQDVDVFKFNGVYFKHENGKPMAVAMSELDAQLYTVDRSNEKKPKVEFDDVGTFRFLSAAGFARLASGDNPGDGYQLIRIDDGIVDRIEDYNVRDFIRDYLRKTCKDSVVLQFFTRKLQTLMAKYQMENLDLIVDDFNDFNPNFQQYFFNNGGVKVTSAGITSEEPFTRVWRDRIVPRKFHRVPLIREIRKVDDRFFIEYTEQGKECVFLQLLINSSNNFFTHDAPREVSDEEQANWNLHIVNKVTALGYLLCNYKFAAERKAVVIQDHKMTEVGQSQGGTGKSILGNAISQIIPQFFIDGKGADVFDQFFLEGVTRATRNIFIDDVKVNFNFERLFTLVTGDMRVNPKQASRYTIRKEVSPKILITTNHAINKADEAATARRIIYMEASGWYNVDHNIFADFNHQLFDDWDKEQWNLFDNLMMECVMYYLRSHDLGWPGEKFKGCGAVQPPMESIQQCSLRQQIGEAMLMWAEEYFDPTGEHLNQRLKRKELMDDFLVNGGYGSDKLSPTAFKRRLVAFCQYKRYDFNPAKPTEKGDWYVDWKKAHPSEAYIGIDDKSGGAEYITISGKKEEEAPQQQIFDYKEEKPF